MLCSRVHLCRGGRQTLKCVWSGVPIKTSDVRLAPRSITQYVSASAQLAALTGRTGQHMVQHR